MRFILIQSFTQSSTFSQVSRVSQGILIHALESLSKTLDTRRSILLDRIYLGARNSRFWQPWVDFLIQKDRKAVDAFLDSLYTSSDMNLLTEQSEALDQFMQIPVCIPHNIVVHQISLEPSPGNRQLTTIGQELDVILSIESTLDWCKVEIPSALYFTYEFQMDDNDWILCGSRRGSFSNLDSFSLDFQLIPLRAGHLLLPTIDIQSSESTIISETQLLSVNLQLLVGDHDRTRIVQI